MEDLSTFNEVDQKRPILEVYDLGRIDFLKALDLQRQYHRRVIDGMQDDVLLACSHEPVISCGTSTLEEHILSSADVITQSGASIVRVERGGSVTYHGPEQAILYPIINLHHHRTDVGWYMRSLEEVAIRTLSDYGIVGNRVPGKTGVWLDENSKIAFSGVRISRWCTLHGLSLTVLPCADKFRFINPCGLGEITITSIAEQTASPPSVQDVTARLMTHFIDVFGYASR